MNKKYLFLFVFLLFLLPSEEIQPPPPIEILDNPITEIIDPITNTTIEEDECEMKKIQFDSVDSTNDDLEDMQNFNNIGYCDSKIWFVEVTNASTNSVQIILKSVSSITGSTTDEDTSTYTIPLWGVNAITNANTKSYSIFTKGDYIIAAFAVEYDVVASGLANQDIMIRYSDDAGTSWTTTKVVTVGIGADGDADDSFLYRPFQIGSSYYIMWSRQSPGIVAGKVNFFKILPTQSTLGYTTIEDWQSVYQGCVYGSDYYFIYENTSNDQILASFDGTSITNEETLAITIPTTYNQEVQLYWNFGNIEIIMDEDHFYVRENGTEGEWTSYFDTGTTTNGIVWKYDNDGNYIPNYIIWKDSIYWINEQGRPLRIQPFTDDAYTGWSDWFSNGADTIYQTDFETVNITAAEFTSQLMTAYKARIEQIDEPETKIWLLLYDDDESTLLGIYKVDSFTEEGGLYKLATSGGDAIDLKVEEDSSYDTKDIPDILTDEIDNYCSFLYQDGNISTTPATTYDKTFKTKNLASKFRWMQAQEGYIISWDPDYNVYYDQFSASGVTILDADTIEEPKPKTESLQYSKIVVYGGFLNGTRLSSVKYGEPNFGTYYDWFAEIVDQTELDNMAAAIEAKKNLTLKKLSIKVIGKGFIRAGTSVTLTNTQYSISGETWYVIYSKYDEMTQICELMLTDAVYIPAANQNTTTEVRIQSNQQNIAVQATNVQTNVSDISDLDSDKLDKLGADDDDYAHIGRAWIGYNGVDSDWAGFGHRDQRSGTNFAFIQRGSDGLVLYNAPTGGQLFFRINDATGIRYDGSSFHPGANKGKDLGKSSLAWDDVYADDYNNVASDSKYQKIDPDEGLNLILSLEKKTENDQIDWEKSSIPEKVKIASKMIPDPHQPDNETIKMIEDRREVSDDYILEKEETIEEHEIISDAKIKSLLFACIQKLNSKIEALEASLAKVLKV